MWSESPAQVPVLRSRHQARILASLLLHPDDEGTATEPARRPGVPLTTVHREVQRQLLARAERMVHAAVAEVRGDS